MKIGETIEYRGYDISHPIKEDYVTSFALDTLKDAKDFIDRLIRQDEIIGEKEQKKGGK